MPGNLIQVSIQVFMLEMLSFISLYLKIELFPLSKGYYIISPVQSDKMTHLTGEASIK
jgi:hypothetical protein